MRIFFIFIIMLLLPPVIQASQFPVQLGDTKVLIVQERQGEGKVFIHLHQNETTALEAARRVIHAQGGQLITLVHPGQRYISFMLHGKHYLFDPNRIFTDRGIQATLLAGGQYSRDAHLAVKRLADAIKALLPSGKIIAVHNNETYSLHDYLPGHALEKDVHLLNQNTSHYFRNFYLVTQQADFYRLSALNFNSVWQSKQAADDGSLSIFLAHREYVNVEAGYDQLPAQISMLEKA